MCESQRWKRTGDKRKVIARIVKMWKSSLTGKDGVDSLISSKIGEPTGVDGPAATLRRFDTNNYPALDRFDRLWYEMRFVHHPRDWQSHFCLSLLHSAVVNARAVYCSAAGARTPMREFLRALVADYGAA